MLLKQVARVQTIQRHLLAIKPRVRVVSPRAKYASGITKNVLETRKSVDVLGSRMSYLDTGAGDKAVVFLHGNPTAAYLWRNIIPHVQGMARCLAPDLIGMGHSDKLSSHDYTYKNHYNYLNAWFDRVDLPDKVTIVCHDWGSGLGFHWCNQHRSRVEAIVHMESLVTAIPNWEAFPSPADQFFQAMRSPEGEAMILDKNLFVELLLPRSIMRKLSDEEMAEYKHPYLEKGESRRPTLTWPREIPIVSDGPQYVVDIAKNYSAWLKSSEVPKLYIDAEPGFFAPFIRDFVADWKNQKVVKAKGLHFVQEDSPNEIGRAIADFLKGVYN